MSDTARKHRKPAPAVPQLNIHQLEELLGQAAPPAEEPSAPETSLEDRARARLRELVGEERYFELVDALLQRYPRRMRELAHAKTAIVRWTLSPGNVGLSFDGETVKFYQHGDDPSGSSRG